MMCLHISLVQYKKIMFVRENQSYICGIQKLVTNVVYRLQVVNDLEYSSEKNVYLS